MFGKPRERAGLFALLVTAVLVGCSSDGSSDRLEEIAAVSAALTGKQRAEIQVPVGTRIESVVAGATDRLTFGISATVGCVSEPCTVSNTGRDVTTLYRFAKVNGDVSSIGPVSLGGSTAVSGFIRTGRP